jgi:hypothetical protein
MKPYGGVGFPHQPVIVLIPTIRPLVSCLYSTQLTVDMIIASSEILAKFVLMGV